MRAAADAPARYRVEEGRACVDLRVRQARQLFDTKDPAPFHERDLDVDAVGYLVGAATEIPRAVPITIVVWISEGDHHVTDANIRAAVHAHFAYERVQIGRRLAAQFRRARMFLVIGLVTLTACVSLAQLAAALPAGRAVDLAREGLIITGWVALWRPLEALLYDWWPLVDDRRLVDRVLEAPLVVRHVAVGADSTSSISLDTSATMS